jgi:nucleoside-diphosphate-sugar epimerase
MQTILGANGTIGKLLANELTAFTKDIRLVSRNPKKVNETDELFPADLSDVANVDKAIQGSEIVYLVVGFEYKLKVWAENWPKLMRATIVACIKYNAKLVFFDNVYLYGKAEIPHMTEESKINPPSKKGVIRKEIAEMLLNQVKAGKLTALIARSADFYGPDNKSSLIIELIYNNFKKRKAGNWLVNADKKHSFTYTPDAAKATALLGNTHDAFNQVWHLPTDKNTLTVRELSALFAKEMNVPNKIFIFRKWLIKLLGLFIPVMKEMPEMLYQYEQDYIFDSSKFDKRFNFQTKTYEEGVKRTVE